MADSDVTGAEDSAEKAYAAAAEAITDKEPMPAPVPAAEAVAEPVEFPARVKRARKPREATAPDGVAPGAAAAAEITPPVAAPLPAAPKAPRGRVGKPATKRAARPAAAKTASAKSATAKPAAAARPAPAKLRKPAAKAKVAAKSAPKPAKAAAKPAAVRPTAPKPVKPAGVAVPKLPFIAQLKEFPMDVTNTLKDAVSGAKTKAKDAFAKTSAVATEYTEFTKGNVEAFVESGKILASGLQDMGGKFLADSKAALETATGDVKALTSVKSPTDFFQLQTELLRRNIDSAVAYSSKTSEAMMKLTNEVMAPLSGRVNLAVEKIKKAA